jgi:hypothetical protein
MPPPGFFLPGFFWPQPAGPGPPPPDASVALLPLAAGGRRGRGGGGGAAAAAKAAADAAAAASPEGGGESAGGEAAAAGAALRGGGEGRAGAAAGGSGKRKRGPEEEEEEETAATTTAAAAAADPGASALLREMRRDAWASVRAARDRQTKPQDSGGKEGPSRGGRGSDSDDEDDGDDDEHGAGKGGPRAGSSASAPAEAGAPGAVLEAAQLAAAEKKEAWWREYVRRRHRERAQEQEQEDEPRAKKSKAGEGGGGGEDQEAEDEEDAAARASSAAFEELWRGGVLPSVAGAWLKEEPGVLARILPPSDGEPPDAPPPKEDSVLREQQQQQRLARLLDRTVTEAVLTDVLRRLDAPGPPPSVTEGLFRLAGLRLEWSDRLAWLDADDKDDEEQQHQGGEEGRGYRRRFASFEGVWDIVHRRAARRIRGLERRRRNPAPLRPSKLLLPPPAAESSGDEDEAEGERGGGPGLRLDDLPPQLAEWRGRMLDHLRSAALRPSAAGAAAAVPSVARLESALRERREDWRRRLVASGDPNLQPSTFRALWGSVSSHLRREAEAEAEAAATAAAAAAACGGDDDEEGDADAVAPREPPIARAADAAAMLDDLMRQFDATRRVVEPGESAFS